MGSSRRSGGDFDGGEEGKRDPYSINNDGSGLTDGKESGGGERKSLSAKGRCDGVLIALLFGVLNAIILVPLMVAYTNIIFRDPFFRPYVPGLVKLVFFSSIVHQISFTSLSTLKFVRRAPNLIHIAAHAQVCTSHTRCLPLPFQMFSTAFSILAILSILSILAIHAILASPFSSFYTPFLCREPAFCTKFFL
jgi:hypothetical protein